MEKPLSHFRKYGNGTRKYGNERTKVENGTGIFLSVFNANYTEYTCEQRERNRNSAFDLRAFTQIEPRK
jgi:hypothetical protein